MECPHCGKDLIVDIAPRYNVDAYGEPKLALARCCGKGVYLIPVRTIRAEAYTGKRTEDDWGNPIKLTS